jgi:hypothetical protein
MGCSSEPSLPADAEDHQSHEGHSKHEGTEVNEAFAKLDSGDQKAALAQKICPVTDQALGSMGTPIKVTVEGRDVFVCCQGCVDKLKDKFDEYVAKLEE